MSNPLRIIECTAGGAARWDEFLSAQPAASFYHRFAWKGINEKNFGHKTFFLAALHGDQIVGIFPLVLVSSRLFGRILCSMPFVNYGGPCSADLPPVGTLLCPVCALPSPAGAVCGDCRAHPPGFDRCLAAHAYAFPVDRLVQGLKYRGLLSIAPALGHRLAVAVRADRVPDIVLPMPLAAARLRERGFNQALEIARMLPAHLAARLRPALLERT